MAERPPELVFRKLRMVFKLFIAVLFIHTTLLSAQELSREEKEILELRDKRTTGIDDRLISYLYSTNPDLRVNAIYALANIGDSILVSKLNFLLGGPYKDYPTAEDLKALIFLLGQIPSQSSRDMLRFLLEDETQSTINKTTFNVLVMDALGKIGEENDLNTLVTDYLIKSSSDSLAARALAMSIARFGIRKIKNKNSIDALKYLFNNSNDKIILRNTAYAFWRTGDKNLLSGASQEIFLLTKSEDPQTRMWAYNAMSKLENKVLLTHLLESFPSENDWRVKVNMLNALTNYKLDSISELTQQLYSVISNSIGDGNEHVSLTTLNVLGKLFNDLKNSRNKEAKSLSKKLKEEFVYALENEVNLSWRIKSELVNAMSSIFKDEIRDHLFKAYSNTTDYDFKSGIIKAFSHFNNGLIYKEVRDSISADVQRYNLKHPDSSGRMIASVDLAKLYRAFVDMLSNVDDKVDENNQNIIRLIFSEFAGSGDPVITDISISALKDSLYIKYSDETASVLAFDFRELEYPIDREIMLIFIDTFGELKNKDFTGILEDKIKSGDYEIAKSSASSLEKITGNKYEFSAAPRTDMDWNFLHSIYSSNLAGDENFKKGLVTIKTNKGDIIIQLFPEVAPFTVMNFLKLAERSFYDGTIFHRVVSNFVIQGGDPTGTGYGGPGYSIRSEFSPLSYERGMVGMASSGKDTEGSQFFITHSATPHLDGKYTIFGKVIDGMDVVDKIMAGDKIEKIFID